MTFKEFWAKAEKEFPTGLYMYQALALDTWIAAQHYRDEEHRQRLKELKRINKGVHLSLLTCIDCYYTGYMVPHEITKKLVCPKCGSRNLASDEEQI